MGPALAFLTFQRRKKLASSLIGPLALDPFLIPLTFTKLGGLVLR